MLTKNHLTKIIKRDGHEEDFNLKKIFQAILKAGKATGEFGDYTAQNLTKSVLQLAREITIDHYPRVEEIQDIIEEVLLSSPFKKTARSYIVYREQHEQLRDIASRFNIDLVEQYLKKQDWQVLENSNMSFSLQGLNHYISSEVSKTYWLNRIYPEQIKGAHLNGDIHIHDLGFLSAYCVGWDLQDLLMHGLTGASGKVESKPAKHFRSALGQIANFFYTLQGETAGAQAFSDFDTLLAPFIRYDKLNYQEVKQALQEFVFNTNIPTRVGFQTPFTNITLNVTVPSYYADHGVVIGGRVQPSTYKEFQHEMNIFNKALTEVMLEGDSKGRGFTFPIPTFNITNDFDWDNPHLNALWALTANYGTPYFANFINSKMKPEDARSMCCRLRIDTRELRNRGGGLFGASPLTGSIGVVTINMARIGFLSKDIDAFFRKLENLMNLAKKSLEIKRKVLEHFTDEDLYPYTKFYLRDNKKRFGQYWKNHFSTIGLIGMNEACLNLFGEDIASKVGQKFTVKVLDFMRGQLIKFQEETHNNYNLEATPAESATYRLAKIDKENYPGIICANETEFQHGHEPFYTNSTHLPVNYSDDIFEVLDRQDKFQERYTGGTVLHIFVGEKINNIKGLKSLIRMICTRYKIPYFTITPTFSICPSCGYITGEHLQCSKCGSECEVFSRVVGYFRPVRQWNEGKKEEFHKRRTYKICA